MEPVAFPVDWENGDCIRGYTAALLDVKDVIDYIANDLKDHHKTLNKKTIIAILDCMIENRHVLKMNPKAFIRCNAKAKNGFEVYIERK